MQLTPFAQATTDDLASLRDGVVDSRVLLTGEPGTPENHRVVFSQAETEWKAPRHRHNFDQVRFVLEGHFEYEPGKLLKKGQVGYFPESVHYGPQVRPPGLKLVLFQFGGASGRGYMSSEEHEKGVAALRGRGRFGAGRYYYRTDSGAEAEKDAYEAVWEEVRRRNMAYAEPRYESVVVLNPESFGWSRVPGMAGVRRRDLGSFTETGTAVGFVSMDAGATLLASAEAAAQLWFVVRGTLMHGDTQLPPHSGFRLERGERQKAFQAATECELMYVQLPTLG